MNGKFSVDFGFIVFKALDNLCRCTVEHPFEILRLSRGLLSWFNEVLVKGTRFYRDRASLVELYWRSCISLLL
ncbi:hypothetical protein P8452_58492 [Trifolium repens]|nr:hypothetical protein P8452_58492 [Trifolium repens]